MNFDLMPFMESMGSSEMPLVAAFFIGLMMAISPCPLTTNMTAIAYVSRRIESSRHTLLVGFLYTLGLAATYVSIAAFIVYVGLNTQDIALFLQEYGPPLLGPLLILIGLVMLEAIRLDGIKMPLRTEKLKERLANQGFIGSFLLGAVFALAFCPFSAVLYFGMLIPLAFRTGDAFVVPAVFAFATGLPVILFSFMLVFGVNRLGTILNKVRTFERLMRKAVAVVFILAGIYYTFLNLDVFISYANKIWMFIISQANRRWI
jgi:cytochrome c-type biogenesis protein